MVFQPPATGMTISDDEDESLALFLESEVLSEVSDQEEEPKAKRMRRTEDKTENLENTEDKGSCSSSSSSAITSNSGGNRLVRIETGILSKIPPELFRHILKFLSSEDLIACSLVCRFLNHAASDESLWQRLYRMRWGLLPPTRKLRECPWKKLYIQRDEEDMVDLGRNCPLEFKEYYIQMQAAKRSQAPLPSQAVPWNFTFRRNLSDCEVTEFSDLLVCISNIALHLTCPDKVNDDGLILDKTVADQVSLWKRSKGLTDNVVTDHACSGEKCTYYQVGDVFVCEKTGQVHVCDDNCREAVMDPANMLWVCRISGHCFDNLLSQAEAESDAEQQQEDPTDEAEPFMGSGRFARAYLLGYNCADEKELEATWRFL